MAPPSTKSDLAVHCRRVAAIAAEIARRLNLAHRDRQLARDASLLHHHPPELLDVKTLEGLASSRAPDRAYPPDLRNILLTFHSCSSLVTDQRLFTLSDIVAAANLLTESVEGRSVEPDAVRRVLTRLRADAEEGFCRPAVLKAIESLPFHQMEDVLASPSGLPVYAAVALKVLALAAESDVSFHKLESLISADQVLAGRIVKVANSLAYSPRQNISTIRLAISYIGIDATRKVLTAASFQPLFASARFHDLWKHSLETGRLCERLAVRTGVHPEEAFLAGLVHDAGRLAIWKLPGDFSEAFARLLEDGCDPVFAERLLLGFSHAEAGAEALRIWNFPATLIDAVRNHHDPDRCGSPLASVLCLAESKTGQTEALWPQSSLQSVIQRVAGVENSSEIPDPEIGVLQCLIVAA